MFTKTLDSLLSRFSKLERDLADLTTARMAEAHQEKETAERAQSRANYLEEEANRAERIRLRLIELLD